MHCDQAREAASAGRHGAAVDPELDAHLAGCAECRAHVAQHAALDRALALDEPVLPRPGFDTRFFARLEAEKAKAPRSRVLRLAWLLVPAAAAVAAAAVLLLRADVPPSPPAATELPAEEIALAIDLEMVEELDVVEHLDELEAYELLSQLDETELDRILAEEK